MTEQTEALPAKVYGDYDQASLDRAFDQRFWAPNADEIIVWYATESAAVRKLLPIERAVAYGESEFETLDIFRAEGKNRPTVIFVHGGAWRLLRKDDSSFPAETFVRAGVNYVALDFAVIPHVRLPDMVAQVRRALSFLAQHGHDFGLDADNVYLCGHSSGAHLAAAALTTRDRADGFSGDVVKGLLCASGSYDLEPVMLSARGRYLQLDRAEQYALSPRHHAHHIACPVIVAYGGGESPEFKRQADEFNAALRAAGRQAELVVAERMNHFEISMTLARRDGFLANAMLKLMNLA